MGRKPKTRRHSYGAWLHYLRKEQKLTQEQLAARIGVPQTTLAYWERTGKLPGRLIFFKMAEVLDVSLNKLLRPANTEKTKAENF